jgi:signal peptidase I
MPSALVNCGLVVAVVAGVALWARRRLVVVTVEGSSMEPGLSAGDRVLVHRRRLARVRRGDIVVLEPPSPDSVVRIRAASSVSGNHLWNIKRVVALPGDAVPVAVRNVGDVRRVPPDALVVFGDSTTSTDSRQRGFYFAADLLGVVVRRMSARPVRSAR